MDDEKGEVVVYLYQQHLFFLALFPCDAVGDGLCCEFDDGQSYYCDDETKSYCNDCCDGFVDKKKNDDLLMRKRKGKIGKKKKERKRNEWDWF